MRTTLSIGYPSVAATPALTSYLGQISDRYLDCSIQLTLSLRRTAFNPALQDVPSTNLAATRSWRGTWFLRIVATPTLAPAYPEAYGLQLQRRTNYDVGSDLDLPQRCI